MVSGRGPRDHGGDLDTAIERFGGDRAAWVDLSTGINPRPYPLPPLPPEAWTALPAAAAEAALARAARRAYGASVSPLPLAGAQAAIQLVPRLAPAGLARVLEPTYNEHRAALAAAGWEVQAAQDLDELAGADLAVVVNPNNPDGRRHAPADLLRLARRVGLLVVDESFADPEPALSLAGAVDDGIIVLRSFGKFYGLAGLRVGFALAAPAQRQALRELAGPWAVSGPAITIAQAALADRAWRERTVHRLAHDATRLDGLATAAGWRVVGGTPLFRLYDTTDAAAAQQRLARARIWSRRFPYARGWLRLGLPDGEEHWMRLATALG